MPLSKPGHFQETATLQPNTRIRYGCLSLSSASVIDRYVHEVTASELPPSCDVSNETYRSISSMGISVLISRPTIESAGFQIWRTLSSAALATSHGSLGFQLKSARWFV